MVRGTNYRQCPAGRGSTCYVEVLGNNLNNFRGSGCGTCNRQGSTFLCTDFTFIFRSATQVEVRVNSARVTRLNVATIIAGNGNNARVCQTTGSPVGGNPFRLTSPAGNINSVRVCFNRKFSHTCPHDLPLFRHVVRLQTRQHMGCAPRRRFEIATHGSHGTTSEPLEFFCFQAAM